VQAMIEMKVLSIGEWMQWQIMGRRGPGRWSSRHFTLDGLRTLCGKKIPHRYEMFRTDAIVDRCLGCCRKYDKLVSSESSKETFQ
jgi:hypothetical protein